jgi:hypothetical protein
VPVNPPSHSRSQSREDPPSPLARRMSSVTRPINPDLEPVPPCVTVNTALATGRETSNPHALLVWNMNQRPLTAHHRWLFGIIPWLSSDSLHSPATYPSVTSLFIISRAFMWDIRITADNAAIGVTCNDVINGIYASLKAKSFSMASSSWQAAKEHVMDTLWFGGILSDSKFLRENPTNPPKQRVTLELQCISEQPS